MEEKLEEINSLTAETSEIGNEFNDPYKTELLSDKWGVVSEILQAQSHRVMMKLKISFIISMSTWCLTACVWFCVIV